MTIWNLGSINIDHFYGVPHIPTAGETLAADGYAMGLGGKGANQSVAAARAGADVRHIGAVGPEGTWAVDRLRNYGVNCDHVMISDQPSGHAIISVAADGENMIVLFGGANMTMPEAHVLDALNGAARGDLLLIQNETVHQTAAARFARSRGMPVLYSAAPFDVDDVRAVMPDITMLLVNEVEADQLQKALGIGLAELPVPQLLVTRGEKGAEFLDTATGQAVQVPAIAVEPVDTTAAGDTFAGYLAAGLDAGHEIEGAMRLASAASALKVTKKGTADAIPSKSDVALFLTERG